MRRALQRLLALVLAVGLVASVPVCSHAQTEPCGSAASHEANDVPTYADLSIDPGDNGSLQGEFPAGAPHNDDGLCKKCCTTCVGANLPSATPTALVTMTASQQMALTLDDNLVAGPLSTEPGIPKPL
jgi:hypothetical protein